MSFCESWATRNGLKSLAHRLGKGCVTPKRVQSKGFGCESCYLHSPSQPSCLKLHRLLIWQSRHQNTTNRRKRERPKSSLASTTLVREQFIVQLNWLCICQQINTKDIICQQYMGYIKNVQNRVCSRICLAYFLGHHVGHTASSSMHVSTSFDPIVCRTWRYQCIICS